MWYIDTDNVIRINGLQNAETLAYIINATVTGILYAVPALQPDVGGVAVNKDPKVEIPCAGHGLEDSDSIRFERSINYNNEYLLQAGSTGEDVLVITASFVDETFTGEEFIYSAVVGSLGNEISFAYVDASDGDYVGKIPYSAPLLQGERYVLCIKEISGGEQVLAKIIHVAGFHGL